MGFLAGAQAGVVEWNKTIKRGLQCSAAKKLKLIMITNANGITSSMIVRRWIE